MAIVIASQDQEAIKLDVKLTVIAILMLISVLKKAVESYSTVAYDVDYGKHYKRSYPWDWNSLASQNMN